MENMKIVQLPWQRDSTGRMKEKGTGDRGKGVDLCLGKVEKRKGKKKSHSVGKIRWLQREWRERKVDHVLYCIRTTKNNLHRNI